MMKRLFFLALVLSLTACDTQLTTLGSSEYGVKFKKLPPPIGGVSDSSIKQPGSFVMVFPWEKLYVFDTKKQIIEWGDRGEGSDKTVADYVQTRALDGNEVSLAVRVEYRINRDTESLVNLVQYVANNDQDLGSLVIAAARADIRTVMNKLKTAEFFDNEKKFSRQEKIKEALSKRLSSFGIIVESVNLEEHRFERVRPDGSIDRSYQERINEVQTKDEDRKREESRIATVRAKKAQEFNDTLRLMNRRVEQSKGYLRQAKLRGDAYYRIKENEAKTIMEAGKAEVEGLTKQIAAFQGPGGEALLKLELVKHLLKNDPKFVLMENGSSADRIGVNKVDTNDLMEQIGVFEGLAKNAPRAKTEASTKRELVNVKPKSNK